MIAASRRAIALDELIRCAPHHTKLCAKQAEGTASPLQPGAMESDQCPTRAWAQAWIHSM